LEKMGETENNGMGKRGRIKEFKVKLRDLFDSLKHGKYQIRRKIEILHDLIQKQLFNYLFLTN